MLPERKVWRTGLLRRWHVRRRWSDLRGHGSGRLHQRRVRRLLDVRGLQHSAVWLPWATQRAGLHRRRLRRVLDQRPVRRRDGVRGRHLRDVLHERPVRPVGAVHRRLLHVLLRSAMCVRPALRFGRLRLDVASAKPFAHRATSWSGPSERPHRRGATHGSRPQSASAPPPSSRTSRNGSTGFTRCASKPDSLLFTRSRSCPYPLSAMSRQRAPWGRSCRRLPSS